MAYDRQHLRSSHFPVSSHTSRRYTEASAYPELLEAVLPSEPESAITHESPLPMYSPRKSPPRPHLARNGSSKSSAELHHATVIDPALFISRPESDDRLHNPGKPAKRRGASRLIADTSYVKGRSGFLTLRGCGNSFVLCLLAFGSCLFYVCYPLYKSFRPERLYFTSGQSMPNVWDTSRFGGISNRALIDADTPDDVKTIIAPDGKTLHLAFSDEFETANRSFYAGMDPYWEAGDLFYAATGDQEYYGPDMITTRNGSLIIRVEKADPKHNHGQKYRSGQLSSWNKLCFQGGLIEASIIMPGISSEAQGVIFWAGFWLTSNLVRPGYRASSEGVWPFTYDVCDVGTVKNQSLNGVPSIGKDFSYLPGQKLSACTCRSQDHPGPKLSDGSFVGRGGSEIDVFELSNQVISQSYQVAPFNHDHKFAGGSQNAYSINSDSGTSTRINSWFGQEYQQALSGISGIPADNFDLQGMDDGFISWMQSGKENWRVNQIALAADPVAKISERPISQEPMAIIFDVAISQAFGGLNQELLDKSLPSSMQVEYVRVYQEAGRESMTCDPPNAPTTEYIKNHMRAYTDWNLTTWKDANYSWPKNRLVDQC